MTTINILNLWLQFRIINGLMLGFQFEEDEDPDASFWSVRLGFIECNFWFE